MIGRALAATPFLLVLGASGCRQAGERPRATTITSAPFTPAPATLVTPAPLIPAPPPSPRATASGPPLVTPGLDNVVTPGTQSPFGVMPGYDSGAP